MSRRKRFDQMLVIDLEASCWEKSPPAGQRSEIIEIGICLVEIASRKIGESCSLLIKPEYSEISDFCTSLTTLRAEDLEAGITLAEACQILEHDFLSAQRPWASWGAYDQRQLQSECRSKGLHYPMSAEHTNVKTWFALKERLSHPIGMDQALAHLNWPLEGTHHRGIDDARNIARLLCHLL